MNKFLHDHLGPIVSILIAVSGVIFIQGVYQSKIDELQIKIDQVSLSVKELEINGTTVAKANQWMINQHSSELINLQEDVRNMNRDLQQIRTDVAIIAAWVKEQQKQ